MVDRLKDLSILRPKRSLSGGNTRRVLTPAGKDREALGGIEFAVRESPRVGLASAKPSFAIP